MTSHVTRPGPLGRVKWASMRALLKSAGRLSKGVRIGYRYGFDSGTMLDYVYVDKAHGAAGIGVLIDRVFLNAVGWRAIRARRALLLATLDEEIHRRGRNVFVLDVAGGPGRYLQQLIAGHPEGRVRVECRDLSEAGLRQGELLAQAKGLGADAITYEVGDALDPKPPSSGAPDVIVVSGLYELLLDEEVIRASMERLRGLLAPGGTMVFTTQTRHPQLDFIAHVLPNREGKLWEMECRSVERAEEWARAAGFGEVESAMETVGLFAVTTAKG
ncbi:class I SAM-dependent methyltransferase family protein [Streptomyces sp. TRM66268-LWL]|uniref:Class I SAM-dependent methyltransferase family protein n=1 Tax=Streptomyces polyasparticus TaxID=2767826 RepID=A0ABR7SAI4_9ACTN|nr:class I SAM-dependent methyltransferase family protein [Streptomyces polyasparticus]MBC9711323.1 class I SAM-dependent methyltransferase family protein [Streptomyces polyasparticus]